MHVDEIERSQGQHRLRKQWQKSLVAVGRDSLCPNNFIVRDQGEATCAEAAQISASGQT